MNTVIVLPGTKWQIPLINKLKKRGFKVIVFDYYENQPAYKYADGYEIVNILDKEKVYELAQKYKPIAVMSDECDIATPTIAWVSEQMEKPSIGVELAALYTDKFRMREFMKNNGFATPIFYKCTTVNEAIQKFKSFGEKMIIKPLDGNSSRGVFSIESEEDIKNHFNKAMSYSKVEKSVLLEEYIEGDEFSIDGIMTNQKYYSLAISHKKHYSYNENLDQELIFKYRDEKYNYDLLRRTNEEYVKKTKLPFGLTHAEYKYRDGKFYLIEIGARGGGNLISSVINPNMTGIETQEALIDWSISRKKAECMKIKYADNYKERCALLSFFDIGNREGIIREIKWIDYLEKEKCIKSFYFEYKKGDTVKKVEDGGNRFGYYIACCNSLEEIERIKNNVKKEVSIEFE